MHTLLKKWDYSLLGLFEHIYQVTYGRINAHEALVAYAAYETRGEVPKWITDFLKENGHALH